MRAGGKNFQAGKPLVSVVTIVYNDAYAIEATMRSVLDQTYPNVEFIVIDGGSVDGTAAIIEKYAGRIDYWVSEKDNGVYDAMNKGIAASTGDWINFMNSGDRFHDSSVIDRIFNNYDMGADVIYGNAVYMVNGKGFLVRPEFNNIRERIPFRHQSCFIKGDVMRRAKYDTSYKLAADYHLIYNLYVNKARFEYQDVTISVCAGDVGLTAKYPMTGYRERLRIRGENIYAPKNMIKLLYLWVRQIIKNMLPHKMMAGIMRKNFEKKANTPPKATPS